MPGEITKIVQDALDKANARLTDEQKEKNRESHEKFFQSIVDVWNNKIPTPWVSPVINPTDDHEELARQCRERWENEIKEVEGDVLETDGKSKAKAPEKSNE